MFFRPAQPVMNSPGFLGSQLFERSAISVLQFGTLVCVFPVFTSCCLPVYNTIGFAGWDEQQRLCRVLAARSVELDGNHVGPTRALMSAGHQV